MAEARTLHVRIMENGDGSGESQERQVESQGEVWIGARRAPLRIVVSAHQTGLQRPWLGSRSRALPLESVGCGSLRVGP